MKRPVHGWLCASGLSLVLFAAIAASWELSPTVRALDLVIDTSLNAMAHAWPTATDVFLIITFFGTSRFLMSGTLAVTVLLLLGRRWQLATAWAITQIVSVVLIEKTKLAFDRARPAFNGEFTREDSYSFPSGHALGSLVAYGMLAYLCVILAPAHFRRAVIVLSALWILLIGFSRMFLGVHFLTDVLGGYALGFAWLALVIALIEDVRMHYGKSPIASNRPAGQ